MLSAAIGQMDNQLRRQKCELATRDYVRYLTMAYMRFCQQKSSQLKRSSAGVRSKSFETDGTCGRQQYCQIIDNHRYVAKLYAVTLDQYVT